MLKKIFKRIKIKFLSTKLVLIFLLLSLATPVGANEGIKLYQFNKHIKQAKQLKASQDYQEASEAFQKARDTLSSTLVLKSLRKAEMEGVENEIEEMKKLVDERVEGTTAEIFPTSAPIPTQFLLPSPTPALTTIEDNSKNKTSIEDKQTTPTPTPTPVTKPSLSPQELYDYDPYYPIILSFSDDKGGLVKFSSYNNYQGSHTFRFTNITLKIGDTIRWKVEASDPKGREILYNFNSNSQRFNDQIGRENGRSKYTRNNEIEYTITEEDLKTAGETLRIVVQIKSEKEYLRFSGLYDDSTFLDYKLRPEN